MLDGYTKDFPPKAQRSTSAAGGKYLAAGQKVIALDGEAPKRVVIQQWGQRRADEGRGARQPNLRRCASSVRKYAKFQSFAIGKGLAQ